jgi:NitT/TauT family transport system ATP-binding protein
MQEDRAEASRTATLAERPPRESAREPAPVVTFSRVGKRFGPVEAVRDIDLAVHEGEFVCLVGPSGSGKSTLLNMAAGLFPPSSGTVRYRGELVSGINRRVGYMTQSDHLLPWRTVARNIAVPLEIAGEPKRQIAQTVERLTTLVGLTGFEASYPSQLSGGMRKRAALARLLAYDPETLLMDEPFGALDAQLRLMLQIELKRLSRALGKTVLFVTHDVDEAIALGDRCVVFSERPGTIREILSVALPPARDLRTLRLDPAYQAQCAKLWRILTPAIEAQAALEGAR